MSRLVCIICLAWMWLLACGCESGERVNRGDGGDADADADADTDADADGDADADSDEEICEEQPFDIEREAGRLMMLVDFSSSMLNLNRWTMARAALTSLLNNGDFTAIEFGFDHFPDSAAISGCAIADLEFDAAPQSQATLLDFIANNGPQSGYLTPLFCAVHNYTRPEYAPAFRAPGKTPYLLLVSDGAPSCSKQACIQGDWDHPDPADMGALTAELAAMGIKTFVIGFMFEISSPNDIQFLNAIAAAGDTGITSYIQADDQAELEQALEQVAGAVVSCTFEIQPADPLSDPNKVNFYFDDDDDPIPQNPGCSQGGSSAGWDWTDDEHTHIELCPDTCALLQEGVHSTLTATFGCQTVVIE